MIGWLYIYLTNDNSQDFIDNPSISYRVYRRVASWAHKNPSGTYTLGVGLLEVRKVYHKIKVQFQSYNFDEIKPKTDLNEIIT